MLLVAALSLGAMLALSLAAGCEPLQQRLLPVLLFSGDNQGVLAACGCPSNPSGGMAKRQGLIESYRRTRPGTLVIDAGDFMPDHKHPVKVKYLAMAAGRAKWDAFALGDQEFAFGLDTLRELQREYQLPFICANVRDEAGNLVVPPHVIRELGGLKIGIFAVIADRAYGWPPLEWRTGLKVEPPIDAARREVQELQGCDIIVAVSHQPIDDTRQLAAETPGIHVVISGHDETVLRKPQRIGDALVVGTGGEGNILGALSVARGTLGRPEIACNLTELSAQVPDASWVMDLYWQYVKEAKDKPPPDWDLTPIPEKYDPPETCAKCHPGEYKQWRTTRHARAFASIKKAGRQDDPECVLCHTMGLGRKGGFVSMAATPQFGRVTCQACHIVTADHAIRNIKPEPQIYINSRLCMSCHGPIQSPNFDYFVYKPKILHHPVARTMKQ